MNKKYMKEISEALAEKHAVLMVGAGFSKNAEKISVVDEYSCAVTPQVRQTGNRLSGLAGTAYASLLA